MFYGLLTVFSPLFNALLFFITIRTYNVLLLLFYIYLFHPTTRGAATLYQNYFRNKMISFREFLRDGQATKAE